MGRQSPHLVRGTTGILANQVQMSVVLVPSEKLHTVAVGASTRPGTRWAIRRSRLFG
jgi:hypothetical protein